MNIKCSFCQTPYAIGRIEKLDALQHLSANNLNHYDAHCPRCRRSTPVLRQKLEMSMPNWRAELKKLEAEMIAHPQHEAPQAKPEPAPVSQTEAPAEGAPAPTKAAAPPKAKPAEKKPKASAKKGKA